VSISVSVERGLKDFSLSVDFRVGEGITALFGPSGAGKTMTLRMIAGLTKPDRGTIEVSGRTLFDAGAGIDLPPRERRVGYLFQQYALFPHLSVERNVGYALARMSREERGERVRSLLALVGLEGFERRRPEQISGGQQQRVALARALAAEPSVLLLDEPFAAVDFRVRRRLRSELRDIQSRTATPMVLVTHDLREVRELSESLVILDRGRVLRAGRTATILPAEGEIPPELLEESLDSSSDPVRP